MEKIRILVVDDHEVVREGLRHLLAQEQDMEVVGQASNSEEVLSQLETLSPNTILMDIKMPDTDGIELTRRVKQRCPACKVIMLTLYDQYLTQAMEAGANGYLLKDVKREELTRSIRQVDEGEVVISEEIKSHMQFANQKKQDVESDLKKIEEVQMVIPPPVEATHLMKLAARTQETLQARVLQVIGSGKSGTIVTTLLEEAMSATDIMERLSKIFEIEALEEEAVDKHAYELLLKKAESLPRLKNRTRKAIIVTFRKEPTTEEAAPLALTGLTTTPIVASDNGSLQSDNAKEAGAATVVIAPAAPTDLTTTPDNEQIRLSWSDNSKAGLAGHNIYRSTTSGGPYTKINGSLVTSSNYTNTELYGGGTYYYVVRAQDNGSLESGNSNEANATAVNVAPAAPAGLTATPDNEQISLSWNDNIETDLAGYNIYRSATSGGPYTKINRGPVTSCRYTDTKLYGGETYYYMVRAVDKGDLESGNSNEVKATAVIAAPLAPTVSSATIVVASDNGSLENGNSNEASTMAVSIFAPAI